MASSLASPAKIRKIIILIIVTVVIIVTIIIIIVVTVVIIVAIIRLAIIVIIVIMVMQQSCLNIYWHREPKTPNGQEGRAEASCRTRGRSQNLGGGERFQWTPCLGP